MPCWRVSERGPSHLEWFCRWWWRILEWHSFGVDLSTIGRVEVHTKWIVNIEGFSSGTVLTILVEKWRIGGLCWFARNHFGNRLERNGCSLGGERVFGKVSVCVCVYAAQGSACICCSTLLSYRADSKVLTTKASSRFHNFFFCNGSYYLWNKLLLYDNITFLFSK